MSELSPAILAWSARQYIASLVPLVRMSATKLRLSRSLSLVSKEHSLLVTMKFGSIVLIAAAAGFAVAAPAKRASVFQWFGSNESGAEFGENTIPGSYVCCASERSILLLTTSRGKNSSSRTLLQSAH